MKTNSKKIKKNRWGLNTIQVVVLATIVVVLFLFSDSNIKKRIDSDRKIKSLKNQIEFYKNQIEEDKIKLQEIQSDKKSLEKYARENYFMKKQNEEVFIIK